MNFRSFSPLFLMLALIATPLLGQNPRAGNRDNPRAKGDADAKFNRDKPTLGDMIPDVTAYDENGKELKLRDLKGKHTVIVFGCLT